MKIIFLDIDGVLNSQEWIEANLAKFESRQLRMTHDLDPDAVQRLQHICSETDAKIVISSTWRKIHDLADLRDILQKHGLTGDIIGVTPNLNRARGREIERWLADRNDVDKFVILDDDSDMEPLMGKLIKTSFRSGLQNTHAALAIAMLGKVEK